MSCWFKAAINVGTAVIKAGGVGRLGKRITALGWHGERAVGGWGKAETL